MASRSAGLLVYRRRGHAVEVFLIHPGGPFWAKKDAGAWSIPKGEYDDAEGPLDAAKREFHEETGHVIEGEFIALEPIRQRGGKVVSAWAVEGDCDAANIVSNTFSMEWPRGSGRMQSFPEADRAGWFGLAEARVKILESQSPLLDQLERILGGDGRDAREGA